MHDHDEVERLTQLFGRELFAQLERGGPLPLSPTWWDDRLMEWTMADQAVKVQLFRFIDVLPQLQSAEETTAHLREYFDEAHASLPAWARLGVRALPRRGLASRVAAWTARKNAERLAKRFIAGSNIEQALRAIAKLRKRKLAFTVDLLGEATITEAEAVQHQEEYLHLIDGLSEQVNSWPMIEQIDCDVTPHPTLSPEGRGEKPLPRVNVSIKLSSLFSQFDPINREGTSAAVRERLRPLFRAAQRNGVFINFDMEQYAYKDLTLRIFREVLDEAEFRAWPDVGIAIQAYLRDCENDLHVLLDWARQRGTPVWVRLIKGAYWDYETVIAAQKNWPSPVFTHKWETDANYEKLSQFLLDNAAWLRPAFGSHNIRSLAHALAYAEKIKLPPRSFEIQMLYGMAEPIKEALVKMGYRVRVYTPYGQLLPGMAYLVRRLLENTADDSFLRASFTEHVSEERLLMKPHHAVAKPNGDDSTADHGPRTTGYFRNESHTDFSKDEARAAMKQALADVKKQLGRSYPPVIAGREVDAGQTFDSINPSHMREVVGHCGRATVEQAKAAVAAAKTAYPSWRDTPPQERAAFLRRAADVMRRRRFELTAWQVYECAKQWREADADVAEAIDFCDYYALEMCRLADPQRVEVPGEENAYFYEPRGIVVVIAPWNFPLAILCGMTTAALVTGNTVIMKPAEQSTVVGAKLMEIFQEVGLPAGVLNFLPGVGEEIGPTLVEHPDVSMIAFTGSRTVGLLLNREAAEHPGYDQVKRVLAEMGGKNAIIVDADADLDEAVQGVVASAFGYQGQKCSACSRAIILASVYDLFLQRLVEAAKSLKISPAEDPGCSVAPVIDADSKQRILGYIEKGKEEAKLAFAGNAGGLEIEGFYVPPHIFADVPPTAVIAQEEIFGPVLAVMKAKDLNEALAIANGTQYALTGGLYSRSPESIRRVKREFRVGNLYINRGTTGALVYRQPFGGFKMSGIGSKAGGPDYLLQFVVPRTITENTMRRGFAPPPEK